MKLAPHLLALLALTAATPALFAQDAEPVARPLAKGATGSTGQTTPKPRPRPLTIDEIEKLQEARNAARAAAAAAGSKGSSAATGAKSVPATTAKPNATLPVGTKPTATALPASTHAVPAASGTTSATRPAAASTKPAPKPAIAATGSTKPAAVTNASPWRVVNPVTGAITTPARPATTAPKPLASTPKPAVATPPKTPAPIVPAKAPAPVLPKPVTPKPASPKPVAAAPQSPAAAPTPLAGPLNRTLIVLDPAHGGGDNGSRIADNVLEKDVTLAFAFKLRSLLQARGFTVVLTRDSDGTPDSSPAPLTLDDRAGIANSPRAVACLLLHATGSGSGVHIYHSELDPAATEATTLPWLTAQAAWVAQSTTMAGKLAQALTRASIPFVSSAASIRPVDSLTCPALVIELAPKGGDISTLNDSSYQQSVSEALAGALVFWKNQAQPPQRAAAPATEAQ